MAVRKDSKPLSTMALKVMKPGDKVLVDTGENTGLRVRCGRGGTKTFYYRYTSPITKKLAQIVIGHFPTMPLAEARQRLQVLKQARKEGRCPASEQKSEEQRLKNQAAQDVGFTVKQLVEFYLTEYIEDRIVNGKLVPGARKKSTDGQKRDGQKEVRRTLEFDVIPVLGHQQARSVTRKDIVNLIMNIVSERGANVQAGNVLRELSSAYEFAIGLEKFDDDFVNPALLAKNSLKQARVRLTSQRGKRVLSDEEIVKYLQWLPGSAFTPTQKAVQRLILLTGCRPGEACMAMKKDINLKKGTWHIKESKTDVERYVQLSKQVIAFLKQLDLSTGDCYFPSQKTGLPIQEKSLTEQAWQLRTKGKMLDIEHWTPHDLRRTVRTGLSRLKCPSEVGEAVLGHSRKGIEGTYDLHKYESECRTWLQEWNDHIDALLAASAA